MPELEALNPAAAVDALSEMQFETLAGFNGGHIGVFWSEAGGPGPWEMHPNEDELLHVIEGKIAIDVLPADRGRGADRVIVDAGSFLVVPRGLWHRHDMLERTQEMYLSPANTVHSDRDDPR
jgi:quercetin dioxygenase-like cupin family protein